MLRDISETVPQDEQRVGIVPILAEEITHVAADQRQVQRGAPVLVERLGVLAFNPNAIAILPDGGFERDASIGVDGVAGSAE